MFKWGLCAEIVNMILKNREFAVEMKDHKLAVRGCRKTMVITKYNNNNTNINTNQWNGEIIDY